MGNCHGLLQMRPHVLKEGVALPVRPERRGEFWRKVAQPLPSYVSAERCTPEFWISNPNTHGSYVSDPAREVAYLVLQSGGKRGYDQDFWHVVEGLSPLLEDARWYFDDQDTGFVDEYLLVDGELERRRVVEEGGSCWDYVMEAFAADDELMFALNYNCAANGGEFGWRADFGYEELKRARALRPGHVPTQLIAVNYLLQQGEFAEALKILHGVQVATDMALEAGSDVERTLAGQLKEVYLQIARVQAGLERHEEALAAFVTADLIIPTWGNHEARLERAQLLRRLGRLEEARTDLGDFLRRETSKHGVARGFLELALIHELLGERDEARRRAEFVLELEWDPKTHDAAEKLLAKLAR